MIQHPVLAALFVVVSETPTQAPWCHITPRFGRAATLVGANALIGAVTAAIRAGAGGRDPVQPFLLGALGGAAHFSGKYAALATVGAAQWAGLAVSSFGSSMIANAGAGRDIRDELYLPLGPTRLRLTRGDGVRFGLNAYESGALIHFATGPDRRFDLGSSLSIGAVVIRDRRALKSVYEERGVGATDGSVVLVSDQAPNPGATLVHEVVHARQFWFLQEAIGRPIEGWFRSAVLHGRYLPEWLELGVTLPLLYRAERLAWSRSPGPLYRGLQYEAEWIECRRG